MPETSGGQTCIVKRSKVLSPWSSRCRSSFHLTWSSKMLSAFKLIVSRSMRRFNNLGVSPPPDKWLDSSNPLRKMLSS